MNFQIFPQIWEILSYYFLNKLSIPLSLWNIINLQMFFFLILSHRSCKVSLFFFTLCFSLNNLKVPIIYLTDSFFCLTHSDMLFFISVKFSTSEFIWSFMTSISLLNCSLYSCFLVSSTLFLAR